MRKFKTLIYQEGPQFTTFSIAGTALLYWVGCNLTVPAMPAIGLFMASPLVVASPVIWLLCKAKERRWDRRNGKP